MTGKGKRVELKLSGHRNGTLKQKACQHSFLIVDHALILFTANGLRQKSPLNVTKKT